jgi:hypothetical protein
LFRRLLAQRCSKEGNSRCSFHGWFPPLIFKR